MILLVYYPYFRLAIILRRVVFPAPEGPRMKVRRPGLITPQAPLIIVKVVLDLRLKHSGNPETNLVLGRDILKS